MQLRNPLHSPMDTAVRASSDSYQGDFPSEPEKLLTNRHGASVTVSARDPGLLKEL
jgi:hypothetical protein